MPKGNISVMQEKPRPLSAKNNHYDNAKCETAITGGAMTHFSLKQVGLPLGILHYSYRLFFFFILLSQKEG